MQTGRPSGSEAISLTRIFGDFTAVYDILQEADAAPTTQAVAACGEVLRNWQKLRERWSQFKQKEIQDLNHRLGESGQSPITTG